MAKVSYCFPNHYNPQKSSETYHSSKKLVLLPKNKYFCNQIP